MFTLGSISSQFDSWEPPTPSLILDLTRVRLSYERLSAALAPIDIHYAVKCNPTPQLISHLLDLGSRFEVASVQELRLVLRTGADAKDVFFSAPVKAPADIQEAYRLGVRIFSIDSDCELEKVVQWAPGASVQIRLATDDHASRWPLSRKFGTSESEASRLAERCAQGGLSIDALSFHVGSQAGDAAAWSAALGSCRRVMEDLSGIGLNVPRINIGGGFPVTYLDEEVPTVEAIGEVVRDEVGGLPYPVTLACEPGRYLVAEAGDTIASVIGVSERHGERWAFLDVGAFNGLFEASGLGGGFEVRSKGDRPRSRGPRAISSRWPLVRR